MTNDGSPGKPSFEFEGFDDPAYTQVPDVVFDRLMANLSESELKVLLYIIRRTYGFKKRSDNISIKQLVEGIVTRDGRRLDYGAGISKASVVRGTKGLVDKKIIIAVRNRAADNADIPTTYQLRRKHSDLVDLVSEFESPPVYKFETQGSVNLSQTGGSILNTQETVKQQTEIQETDRIIDISKSPARERKFSEARENLSQFVIDFAREFGDEAPTGSSLSRIVNIYLRSGLSMDDFIGVIYDARQATKEHTQNVTKRASDSPLARKNQMPYFFRVIENLVEEEQSSTR